MIPDKFKTAILIFFIVPLMFSCDDDVDHDPIPSVHVNRTITLNTPSYSDLNPRGGYVYLDEGYRGIIVYHSLDGEYFAFERACTYHPNSDCGIVSFRSSSIEMECGEYVEEDGEEVWEECCGSKFYTDGTVQSGPARRPLKQYNVTSRGNDLIISN